MNYLIGGAPGAGKTTLGLELASRLGLPSLAIDDIRTALLDVTTPHSHPDLHTISLPDPWTYFTNTAPDVQIEHAVAQHSELWPGIQRILRKRAASQKHIVIDGWHLMPSLVAAAELPNTEAYWIDVDHDVLGQRERGVWDFYAKSDDPERMFANFLARSFVWNDLMRDAALAAGFGVLHQDGSRSAADLADEILS